MFERSVIQEVRRKTDFVALVGEYRPVKKQGSRWVCRCPFHEEKTASFNISPDVGLAVCFGCKWGGDAIRFVEHLEGLSFPEALRHLGERAGVDLPETRDPTLVARERQERDVRARLHAVCESAAAFFEEQLTEAPFSELARGALEERGVGPQLAAAFRLGYAPASWDALASHLSARGFSPADAELAGLLLPSRIGRGYHDRFRHRLMFPVLDRSGKVVAFSGRILPATEDMPEGIVPVETGKYINSPETPIFTKGAHLYGLAAARGSMLTRDRAILVEGNFDVVQMHGRGFTETVAPLGTAFTPEQATLLRRMADRVTLLFDGDAAGRRAARASHAVCEEAGLVARVGVLPLGSDPDSFLRARGEVAMGAVLQAAPGMTEWIIRDVASQAGGGSMVSTADRVVAARELAPILASMRDGIELREAVRSAARDLVLSEDAVMQAVRDHRAKAREDAKGPLPTRRTHANRPGLTPLGPRGDSPGEARRHAYAAGVEAVLYDPKLLPSELTERLIVHLRPPVDAIVREARAQWERGERLDGPAILEAVPPEADPEGKIRTWTAERLIPADEDVVDRCSTALRDAVARLDLCRDMEEAEARRVEGMRLGAGGDRTSEIDVLERQRVAAREAATRARASTGTPHATGRGGRVN